MDNIKKIREEAFLLANTEYEAGNPIYTKCSPIYLAPTGNVKDMMKIYSEATDVLTVGGSGSFGFEAALNNAHSVDMFDINALQKLFFEMIFMAIKHMEYDEFVKYLSLKEQFPMMKKDCIKNYVSNDFFEKISPYLSEDANYVFGPLFDYFISTDLVLSSLFRFEHPVTIDYLKQFTSYYNKESFQRLKEIIKTNECSFDYRCVSLIDLPDCCDKRYDLIVLGNIFQYYKQFPGLDTPEKVLNFVRDKLTRLLKENGAIQVSYGFEVATVAFKMSQNIPLDEDGISNRLSNSLYGKLLTVKELAEGINIPLYKSGEYSYDFFRGVETYEGRNSDNMVLTYKKQI